MKFNQKAMLICVSDNGYLIEELAKAGYSNEGTYYYGILNQETLNYKFERKLRRLFKKFKELESFQVRYRAACDKLQHIEALKALVDKLPSEKSGSKIIILVSGGIVQEVYATEPMKVIVNDMDNEDTSYPPEEWDSLMEGMVQIL